MNLAHVEPIADAVLYEGYLLYPYRAGALKNRARWTFGVLCPEADARGAYEPWALQSECLLMGGPDSEVEAAVRFLHPIARQVARLVRPGADPSELGAEMQPVDALWVGQRLLETGQEASPQRIDTGPLAVRGLAGGRRQVPFVCEAGGTREPVGDGSGRAVAVLVRTQERLEGILELAATPLSDDAYRLTVRVLNVTPPAAHGEARPPGAVMRSFVSTHVILSVSGGEFVSLLDPPAALQEAAGGCRNVGAWPVLVGDRARRDTVLCSPIILEDHPQVAPESPGDLFDGTEIDELLTLRILTLTDEERRGMAAADPRTRELLERTERLAPEQLSRLHGAFRRRVCDGRPGSVEVDGKHVGAGDRVRLRPRGRGDIFDLALAGRSATVVSVEQDFDDRLYLTVAVDDDPGKDLGLEGRPGHRFFFGLDEVEPLSGGG